MNVSETIPGWLREQDEKSLARLFECADNVRKSGVGDEVHLRGLVEISNHCVRQCGYCGLRNGNKTLERYRMREEEIIACAHDAVIYGYGTVVMQSGEDYGIETKWLADIIRRIKTETPLAVTLSLGERPDEDLETWRAVGADRYLLRFETSDPELYKIIHPDLPGKVSDRVAMLRRLRGIGYEIGGGVMVGIPGQTYESLAKDIETFHELDLDMIGVGPYIPHPSTPLGSGQRIQPIPVAEQVPNTEIMVYKTIALSRIVCQEANIPSTTALATINREAGRELGLLCGANIVMPNITPVQYRAKYEIYPAKVCISETSRECHACLIKRIEAIGRFVGKGQGGRMRNYAETDLALLSDFLKITV